MPPVGGEGEGEGRIHNGVIRMGGRGGITMTPLYHTVQKDVVNSIITPALP
jgi:hypothetical protein